MSISLPSRVSISIDRLVLRGFFADQRMAIAGQLRSELARLLADPHVAASVAQGRHREALRIAEPVRMASAAHGPVGAQAAASIIRGLRR